MPSQSEVRALVESYDGIVSAVRARVIVYVTAAWQALPAYDRPDIDLFVSRVVPVVTGGQRRISSLTDAYLAQIETAVLGKPTRPVGIRPPTIESIRGVPAEKVYGRAGVEVWTALSDGVDYTEAVARGLDRATSSAATDLQLARTHTARDVMAGKSSIVGYRRVLHPPSCDLCIRSSRNRYSKSTLQPIHSHCDCGIVPIFHDFDPGQITNQTYETQGIAQMVVHDHGELGPVLTFSGQKFTPAP